MIFQRALAAEKRILRQLVDKGEKRPILATCFDCAADITGKVPLSTTIIYFAPQNV